MKVKFAGNEAKVPDFLSNEIMLAERRLLQSVKCFNKPDCRCPQLQGGAH